MQTWALITGGAKRLGKGIACKLHQRGFNIVIHYHQSVDEANQLCCDLNNIRASSATTIQADLSTQLGLYQLVDGIKHQSLAVKVLVNNASAFNPSPLESLSYEACQSVVATNLISPYMLAKELQTSLVQHHGCIINLLDIHATKPLKNYGLYSISKAALEMATLSLAQEMGPDIRVNGVAPGAILWPKHTNSEKQKQIIDQIPMGRLGTVEDIASAVCYLVDATYVSGQVITVDGGRSAMGYSGA